MLWTEKYRPTTFDEITGNADTVASIESSVKSDDMPHMAFFGPAGVGKTTTGEVIARHYFGSVDDSSFLTLNASDERGIDVIRKRVKKFAGRKSLSGNFKIVFLDEGDSLTRDAQQALRRTMEEYADSCRFIITGNYPSNVIDPIKSRCNVHEFEPISKPECVRALHNISEAENLSVSDETLEKIATIYRGDLRKQINKLQEISHMDDFDPSKLDSGEEYMKLYKYVMQEPNYMAASKLASKETLDRLYNFILDKDEIPGRVKAEISILYAKYMWRMDKGSARDIQMNALVAELTKTLQEFRNA